MKDVLSSPALYDTFEVRVVAPALVVVVEKDAPARLELAGVHTEADALALQDFIASDPLAALVREAYFMNGHDDPVRFAREDRYAKRLEAGRSLATLRVSDREEPR